MSNGGESAHNQLTLSEPELRLGDSGCEVVRLQQLLAHQGVALAIDGGFGNQTQFEVITFQESHQLPADGVVNTETWAALEPYKYLGKRLPLKLGDRGWAVTEVQKLLMAQGAFVIADGVFGFITRAAVQIFQHEHHLAATGEIDRATWAALKPPMAID